MNTPFIGAMHLSLPLLLLLGKATVILLAALGITLAMQRTSAGARHLVWLVTLATLLLVPVLTAWGPVKVAVLPAAGEAGSTITDRDSRILPSVEPDAVPRPVAAASAAPAPTIADPRSSILDRGSIVDRSAIASLSSIELLVAFYALVAAAIFASLAWSGLVVRRIVRHASPLEHVSWKTPLYEVADRMELADAPRLLKSDDVKMPFACGILTPTIVLPGDCDDWSMERRRAVLLHELAHVRRHDLLGHTLGRLACAFYWFHPLVWTAARHLRNESERACDDLALSCGTRATDYAEHLLEIVTSVRRDITPSVALAMARRKEFEGRMLAILDPELRHSSPTRRQSAALIGSLALVALTVGAVSPVARVAEAAPAGAATPSTQDTATRKRTYDASSRLLAAERTAEQRDSVYWQSSRADTEVNRVSNRVANRIAHQVSSQVANQVAQRIAGEAVDDELEKAATEIGTVVGSTVKSTVGSVINSLTGAATGKTEHEVAAPSREASMRMLTAPARGQSRDERVRLLAKVLATDTSATLRRVAAWGLHEHTGQQEAIEALANALRRDNSATVREMAAWALGEGGDRSSTASDALTTALRSDADDKVRATAAWALGEAGDRSAIGALVSALTSSSANVRVRALWAIGTIEPKEAPRAVIDMLRDPEARVRHLAAWALFQIEDPAAVGPLQEALKAEPSKDVQVAIIRAIGAAGEHSVEALKALVESNDPRMRNIAVRALAGRDASGPWPWPWPEPRPYP